MNGVALRRAPVEQPHRQAEIGLDHEIAVGRRGLRNGAEMDDGIEPAALQPVRQFGRRHDVGELALGEIAPFAVMAEQVANGDVGAARVIQRGHDVRSDKTGAPGHQQHSAPCPDCGMPALPQSRPAGNLGRRLGEDGWARRRRTLPPRRGAVTDRPNQRLRSHQRYEYKFRHITTPRRTRTTPGRS